MFISPCFHVLHLKRFLCIFLIPLFLFSFFSSPSFFPLSSPLVERHKEIEGMYNLHWNVFSTSDDFLFFISQWFLLCCNSIPTLHQPLMLRGRGVCDRYNSLKSSILPLLTDLYLLLHSFKQIRANHYIEPWLLFSEEQRRALEGLGLNDLSGEKFRSLCSLRSLGMRHCLQEEKAKESLLPSPSSSPSPPLFESDWSAWRSSVVWDDLM